MGLNAKLVEDIIQDLMTDEFSQNKLLTQKFNIKILELYKL